MARQNTAALEVAIEETWTDLELDDFIAWNDAQRRARLGDEQVDTDNARTAQMLEDAANSPHRLSNDLKHTVADAIWEAMSVKGITRAELARRLGKSRAYVTKLLSGGQNLTLESLAQLSEIAGCDLQIHMRPRFGHTQLLPSLAQVTAVRSTVALELISGSLSGPYARNRFTGFQRPQAIPIGDRPCNIQVSSDVESSEVRRQIA